MVDRSTPCAQGDGSAGVGSDSADKLDAVARAICQERCAFYGEPPCWEVAPEDWPNPCCDDPGCHALAQVAAEALR